MSIKGEIASANKKTSFKHETNIQSFIEKNNYSKENVYNADKTGLNYKMMSSKTSVACHEKEV